MSVKKIVVAKGTYNNKVHNILVGLNENDLPIDIIDIDKTLVGSVHKVSVEKVLKDIDASIVRFTDINVKGFIENKTLKPDKFLVRHSKEKPVCQQDEFYCMVTQDRKGSKPCTCTFVEDYVADRDFLSYYLNNIADEDAIVIDDNTWNAGDADISLWETYGFTGILNKALSKVIHLKNDANLVLEATEALTVVDVNTGKGTKKRDFYDTNLFAVNELARQLRLRNISGIIVVDLLKDMTREQQNELIAAFNSASKDDYCNVKVHGFTHLGLLEVTRTRKLSVLCEIF